MAIKLNPLLRKMIVSAIVLGVFAITGTTMVAFTFEQTKDQIAENQKQATLKSLHQLIPPNKHDNDLYTDTLEITNLELLVVKNQ